MKTAIKKRDLKQAQTVIMKNTRIEAGTYHELVFTIGTRFAEHFSALFLNKNDLFTSLTQDKRFGFWDWFRLKWLIDDAAILNYNGLSFPASYEQLKEAMIGDALLEEELLHLINHKI